MIYHHFDGKPNNLPSKGDVKPFTPGWMIYYTPKYNKTNPNQKYLKNSNL